MSAIVGPSGSGKSTLLNIIGCLDTPTSGEVLIDGQGVVGVSKKELAHIRSQKVGFIFQSFHLIPVFTAYENVEFALQIEGTTKPSERKDIIMPLLDSLGIGQLANRRPGEMSGGQQQRVAIARALVKKPALILADEPTANLDSKTSMSIVEQMVQLNQEEGVTFVLSTHDPMLMEAIPRVVRLLDGKIVDDGLEG
ncbi:MAG: ABC transporter ATP-binding protein [Deltaproteobacteria bacterium]|nr:MAG: ABC transporter ATP-binding protein [Deltaproteobacteria bacterium]